MNIDVDAKLIESKDLEYDEMVQKINTFSETNNELNLEDKEKVVNLLEFLSTHENL